jgi:membrane-associated phospholipid phosphatase
MVVAKDSYERFVSIMWSIRIIVRSTMPQPLVLDISEENAGEVPLFLPARMRLARYVSTLLAPAVVSVPLVLCAALYHTQDIAQALMYAGITLLFLSFGPLLYILLGVRSGKFSDVDVSNRRERTMPFLFGIASITVGLVVLLSLHGPKDLETVLMGTALSGLIMMVITWWWKISIHAATMGGAITMLAALYGAIMLPGVALLVLVSWSRVVLRRHTAAQVVGGSMAGIILMVITLLARGI